MTSEEIANVYSKYTKNLINGEWLYVEKEIKPSDDDKKMVAAIATVVDIVMDRLSCSVKAFKAKDDEGDGDDTITSTSLEEPLKCMSSALYNELVELGVKDLKEIKGFSLTRGPMLYISGRMVALDSNEGKERIKELKEIMERSNLGFWNYSEKSL